MSDARDDAIAEDAAELARELRALREQLVEERRRPPRGPLGLPRPPTPREFVEFADEVAIPATIAILETNIRLLEALQRAIRLAEGGRRAEERGRRAGGRARSTAETVGRETLSRASDALADLQSVLEGTELPEDEPARSILTEARDLRREIQEQLTASRSRDHTLDEYEDGEPVGDGTPVDVSGAGAEEAGDGDADEEPVTIDVDAELETLKEQYAEERDGEDEAGASDDADGAAGADDDAGGGDTGAEGEPSEGDDGTPTDGASR